MKTELVVTAVVRFEDDEADAVKSFLFEALNLDRGVMLNTDPRARDVARHLANELDKVSQIEMPPF